MAKLTSLRENERIALRQLKEKLSERFQLVDLRLFGSKARGDDTPDSDIDVMIELEELRPEMKLQIYDIIYDINLENDAFISATIFCKKEIEDGPISESPIYKTIQTHGVAV